MRVLDISRGIAGGYCAAMLRLAGATVVRTDITSARFEPVRDDRFALAYVRQGREDLPPIDLDESPAAFLDCIESVDCVVEDWGAGVLELVTCGEQELRERSPSLVLTRISNFGQTGPHAQWAASELVTLAAGGMLFLTGTWDRPPVQLAPYQAQLTSGLLAAVATLGALASDEAVTIDLSKQEAVLALVNPAVSEYLYSGTIASRDGQVAAMPRIEQAKDRWVYIGPGAAANADYQRFAACIGIPEFAEERFATADARMNNWPEHQQLLQPKLLERTAREWVDEGADHRLTFGHVQSTTDLLADAVLADRGFFGDASVGGQPVRTPLAPYIIDDHRPSQL
jgi:crotonobetainyl-CoA:carnitine CoA-transferase CaiB-like acyl-CoA transferase